MDYEKLLKKCKRKPLLDIAQESVVKVTIGKEGLYKILPNREPFIFLDGISGIDLENRAVVGHRYISSADPVFGGHFPGNPIYPGVLQLEMISELFCCLYYFVSQNSVEVSDNGPVQLRATRMHDAILQHPVLPETTVTIITQVLELTPYTYTGIGQLMTGEKVAIAVVGEFYIVE